MMAAAAPPAPCRVVIFGGDRRLLWLEDPKGVGGFRVDCAIGTDHEASRLCAAMQTGAISHVVLLQRWCGHSQSVAIKRAADRAGVRVITWTKGVGTLRAELGALVRGEVTPSTAEVTPLRAADAVAPPGPSDYMAPEHHAGPVTSTSTDPRQANLFPAEPEPPAEQASPAPPAPRTERSAEFFADLEKAGYAGPWRLTSPGAAAWIVVLDGATYHFGSKADALAALGAGNGRARLFKEIKTRVTVVIDE